MMSNRLFAVASCSKAETVLSHVEEVGSIFAQPSASFCRLLLEPLRRIDSYIPHVYIMRTTDAYDTGPPCYLESVLSFSPSRLHPMFIQVRGSVVLYFVDVSGRPFRLYVERQLTDRLDLTSSGRYCCPVHSVLSVRSVDAAAAVVEVRRGPACFERDGPGSEPGILESDRVGVEGDRL
jgi:hypothetical protein